MAKTLELRSVSQLYQHWI